MEGSHYWESSINFYPRPPRGGRPSSVSLAAAAFYFYPRPPRGGRREDVRVSRQRRGISIHALREEGDQQLDGRDNL